ncbi:MAG: sulfatase-like hydrolase/transferase [Bryobacteraceae bacterium]|nr:sulfatase-like hydrolase/transferase [Bryobacteraceae bacterium]
MANMISRRSFAASSAAAALAQSGSKPNILWITCEDIGPHIGAYGDTYATTPNLDRLAARSLLYSNCWSNAPVCAPARTTIISGMYPPSTGAEHMRSMVRLPGSTRMYPQLLREAGYYATNNSKTDYNLEEPGKVWDESSNKAHWRNRKAGQPFFSIFNFTITHESQIRTRPHTWKHDPAKARIPAYHPDTPEVRQDWAQYYDNITTMDGMAGKVLAELESDGLAQDTIVFFYGDHGSGMPRNKRWPYNSGLHVPFLVHVPEKYRNLAAKDYRPGGKTDRLVSFVDLAPTLMSLIGHKPPGWMQGHAFLGPHAAPEQPFVYGFRGRMDERYDMVRSVRDKRYVYIRNYMPHVIYGQHIAYMFETPTTRVWKQRYDEGKLTPAQKHFWETKPAEELYDLEADPDEVNNLADSASHQQIKKKLRTAQQDLARRIRDIGFLPEDEIHTRGAASSPYEAGHDARAYPLERVMLAAELASSGKSDGAAQLAKYMGDPDSAVRFWGAMGILMRGAAAVKTHNAALRKALSDPADSVKVAAAQALGQFGTEDDVAAALPVLIDLADCEKNQYFVALRAMNALDALDQRAKPVAAQIAALPRRNAKANPRTSGYPAGVIEKMLRDLNGR